MEEKSSKSRPEHWLAEGLISALSLGAVLVLVGLVFVNNPNLWKDIANFSNSLETIRVAGTSVFLLAPIVPSAQTGVYTALVQFDLGLGILQVIILAARLLARSRTRRIAETVGSVVFWFGASYLTQTYLNSTTTQNTWFEYWAAILMLFGVSLIVRGITILIARKATS